MFLHMLREYTRTAHAAIESDVDVLNRLQTRESYAATLGQYLGFFEPIERRLRQMPSVGESESDSTPRTQRLKRDLAALGMTMDQVARLPRCQGLPPLDSPGQRMGCRYVIEGSALGGQIIYRLIRERFGMNAESGASFFVGDEPNTGRCWRDFGIELEAFAASASLDERTAALESALATFDALGAWFREGERENLVG